MLRELDQGVSTILAVHPECFHVGALREVPKAMPLFMQLREALAETQTQWCSMFNEAEVPELPGHEVEE